MRIIMSNITVTNATVLLNDSGSTLSQSMSAIFNSRVMEVKEFEMSPMPTQVSDKPCSDTISSQTPTAVKLPGSLDALLYIVIVLMFYAFSIVVLMVKYIRREREEASLRSYYHEFVSREKFKSAQYKNRQFMKRIFSKHGDFDQETIASLEDETRCPEESRKNETVPEGNTFSRHLLDFEEEEKGRDKERTFTFLGAKTQFCKNTIFGKRFCNKQLCSKCVSENVPTIDWDEDQTDKGDSTNSNCDESIRKIIEVTLHRSLLEESQQSAKIQPCYMDDLLYSYNSRFTGSENLFYPIVECDGERETEFKDDNIRTDLSSRESKPIRKPSNDAQRETPIDEQAIVSSCSLEVSELLANMPPLGISNSPSNDMDTLDGLSNLDSETENQSLLNYSSSIRHCRDQNSLCESKRSSDEFADSGRFLNINGTDRSDKLSDRSSLLSCSFSFDDGDKSTNSSQYMSKDFQTTYSNSKNHLKKTDTFNKSNGKVLHDIPISCSEKNEDDGMARLLNDITVLADQSGVFRNLKYFLRGFYKGDIEDPSENSNLLPKETYFGPGSPKCLKRNDHFLSSRMNGDGDTTHFNHGENFLKEDFNLPKEEFNLLKEEFNLPKEEFSLPKDDLTSSTDLFQSLGNRWAYTYDEDDGVISDTDRSSSFGDYCMGEAAESQIIDLSKPLSRRDIDSKVKDGLSRALIGIDDVDLYLNNYTEYKKTNPMLAGYGPARKETKV